jgi:hypothetical protein
VLEKGAAESEIKSGVKVYFVCSHQKSRQCGEFFSRLFYGDGAEVYAYVFAASRKFEDWIKFAWTATDV